MLTIALLEAASRFRDLGRVCSLNQRAVGLERLAQAGVVALSKVNHGPTIGVLSAAASEGLEEGDAVRVRVEQRPDTGAERHPRSCG